MPHINLITTCSNSKGKSNSTLRLDGIKHKYDNLHELALSWSNLITENMQNNQPTDAINLYKGSHWTNALKAKKHEFVDLWVISAGLGLINANDSTINYQATFTPNCDDSIPTYGMTSKESSRVWWSHLCKIKNNYSRCKSIAHLMQSKHDELFIIAGSNIYINAILDDLIQGAKFLSNPQKQLVIITSSTESFSEKKIIKDCFLSSSKLMLPWLKCNATSLNICLANKFIELLKEQNFDYCSTKNSINQMHNTIPAIVKSDKIKCTDEYLRIYISTELQSNSNLSATKCLIKLRSSGRCAEERRFRKVFLDIKNSYK
ncbi:hypothetical protein [Aeromonas sp. s7(2024)]|uniref:hypothetical protein n=1 Tax=Aeromonas TaxID=642 RepID=UPI0034A3D8DC